MERPFVPIHFFLNLFSKNWLFQVRNMSWFQDDDHFFFVAEYFFTGNVADSPPDRSALDADCWRRHQQTGKRGLLRIHSADPCIRRRIPWLIEAPKSGHLLLQLPANAALVRPKTSGGITSGGIASGDEEECLTDNRLFIYSISNGQAHFYREICLCGPDSGVSSGQSLYSPGWADRDWFDGLLVVASLQGKESDWPVTVPWLAVFKDSQIRRMAAPPAYNTSGGFFQVGSANLMTCRTGCPVLGVCLSAESWCDDHVDCPDGADEADCVRLIYWPLWVGLVLILVVVAATGVVYAHLRRRCHAGQQRYHVARKYKQSKCQDKFSSVTVNLTKGYEKSGPGSFFQLCKSFASIFLLTGKIFVVATLQVPDIRPTNPIYPTGPWKRSTSTIGLPVFDPSRFKFCHFEMTLLAHFHF